MSDCLEVLFVSDKNGKVHTATCYDPHVGTTLMTYRNGGASAKKCLCVIGNDYLISADENKPLLHVWPLNSQEPSHDLRTVAPGKPSALSVSPDGHYCVAGIEGKIYIWEISSGSLLNVISRHYHKINKVLFMDDSSHFITCGEDGLILVWKLADVLSKKFGDTFKISTGQISPIYNFSNHSLPVTDIFIGSGSLKSRLFSVSVDQTCKIFNLSDGRLLLSIVFNYVLTSVAVNELETELFVGTSTGKIQVYNLDPFPNSLEHHVPETLENNFFVGHTKSVNFLSLSYNGITLASGSDDEKVFLWNIPGRQLIRSFELKGPVSSMFFSFASKNIFSNTFNPALIVSKFEKVCNLEEKNLELNVLVHENINPISFESEFEEVHRDKHVEDESDVAALKREILKLKSINKQLHQFAMNRILKNPLTIGLNNQDGRLENQNDVNNSTFTS